MYHEGHHDHVSNWIPSYVGNTMKRTNWFMRVKSKWFNLRRPVASCNSGSNWSVDLHKISHCMIMLLWLIYSMTTHLGLDCFTFPVLFVTLISCGVLIAFRYMGMGSIVWCKLLAMVNVWCFEDVSYVKMVDVLVFLVEHIDITFDNRKLNGLCWWKLSQFGHVMGRINSQLT
jgi:hypothetical protein